VLPILIKEALKMGILSKIKDKLSSKEFYGDDFPEEFEEDYIELEPEVKPQKSKIVIRPFVIKDFADIKEPLDCLREGYTIALVNIAPIKERDIIELKRVINKLKKTCEAIDGDIAGFGEDWVVATPSFATIHREKSIEEVN
jgi:SepF-like predicted cell division protein (DUF552 family)